MIKRLAFVALVLAFFANASEYDWENSYGKSDPVAIATPPPNVVTAPVDETSWSISAHPLALLIYTALGSPWVMLTVENNLSENFSLISRPELMWATFAGGELFSYGLYEGVRYYTNPGHRGWYFSPQIGYEHVSLDYDSDVDHHRYTSCGEIDALIVVFYSGYKFQSGHFVMSSDVGIGYTILSAKDVGDGDADKAVQSGIGFDLNYTIGYAF